MAEINDDQLVERLVPKVLSSIRTKAKAVETIPIKADLEGITSLPAYDTTGEQFRCVLVHMDALAEAARKPIREDIADIEQQVATKQDELVSGKNIKTINGQSILGEGNIIIEGEGGGSIDMKVLDAYMPMSRDFSDDFNDSFAR